MKKGTIQSDIAETLLELGQTTAKQSAKSVARTLNPLSTLEKTPAFPGIEGKPMEQVKEGMNASGLNFDKLKSQYENQDNMQLEMMRNKLFKYVKEGEEKAIAERRQEEENRIKKEVMEKQEKEKQAAAQAQQPADIPQGKQRRSIFAAHKKKADLSHAETKPSVSKG